MINSLEATKSLITQAQNQLEDGEVAKAQESMNTAFNRLKGDLANINNQDKGGISTERM